MTPRTSPRPDGSPAPAGPDRAERPGRTSVLHRWPAVLGLLVAVLGAAGGADRDLVALTVTVAALCYLAAAALGRPSASWWALPGASALIVVARFVDVAPFAVLGAAAAVLVVVGLVRRRDRRVLTAQTVALLAYGGAAVLALAIDPRAGLALVAVVLIAHGAWDVVHLRRRTVVAPSMAEFCVFLDVPLGTLALVAAVTT